LLVVSWNLFHGRAVPPVNRSLYDCFADRLGGWRWDVALLQEVPPWWPARLARDLNVEQRSALTSRNWLLPLRRALAERRPELLKSNGGGCNAILARSEIVEHRVLPLRRWPERRVAQLTRLRDGTRVVNLHASTRPARAAEELQGVWKVVLQWAGDDRVVLGGDLNLRTPKAPPLAARPAAVPAPASERPSPITSPIVHVAGAGVDHLFARGFAAVQAEAERSMRCAAGSLPPARGLRSTLRLDGASVELSDHAPLLVELQAQSR
jgi:endonuclease/exonuclease/phosphatase family metal-dependent hydrolase